MDIQNYKGKIEIKNISGGRIALGRLAIAHNDSKIINPMFYPPEVSKALEIFLFRGSIEVTPVDTEVETKKVGTNVVKKESIKNEKGEKHEHTVYDPETAKRNKLIEVTEIGDNHKAVAVNSMTKGEAEDFLAQHWKKIEKEVELVSDFKKLEFILSVANEIGMNGNKKYELIEDRIQALK